MRKDSWLQAWAITIRRYPACASGQIWNDGQKLQCVFITADYFALKPLSVCTSSSRKTDYKPVIRQTTWHSSRSLMTGLLPVPKQVFQRVRSSASTFNFQCALVSLSSTYIFFLVFLSLLASSCLSFNSVFYGTVATQDVTSPVKPFFLLLHTAYFFHHTNKSGYFSRYCN